MGVVPSNFQDSNFLTPCCSDCGIFLCWDISLEEYNAHKKFWDAWKCEICESGSEYVFDDMVAHILRGGKEKVLIELENEITTITNRNNLHKK